MFIRYRENSSFSRSIALMGSKSTSIIFILSALRLTIRHFLMLMRVRTPLSTPCVVVTKQQIALSRRETRLTDTRMK